MVFQGSFMVFRGSWLVFMVFHGSFIVFMVLGWFSWFFRSIRNAGRSGVEGRPAPDTNSPSTACWVLLLTLWTLCDYSTHFVFFLECTPRIWYWLFCSHLPCVHCTVFCVNIFLTFNHTYVVETIFRVGQQKCVIQILNEINFHRDTNTAQRQIHPQIEIQVQWGSASSSSMVLSQMSQTRRAAAPSLNIFPLTINLICLEYFSD